MSTTQASRQIRGKSVTYLGNIENPRHGKLHVVVKPHCFEKRRRVVDLEKKKLHVMPRHFRFHVVLTSALMPTNCFRGSISIRGPKFAWLRVRTWKNIIPIPI